MTDILDHTATMVALAIDTYRTRATGPTIRELAADTGLGIGAVTAALNRLTGAGLIRPRLAATTGYRVPGTLCLTGRFVPLENGDVA